MTTGVLACLAAALLFGASTPVAKVLLAGIGPFTLAGLLYLGAALAALPFSRAGGSAELRKDRGQRVRLAGAVIVGGVIAPVLLLFGLRAAPAGTVSLWLNAEAVATVLLAWSLFKDPLGLRGAVAAAIVVAAGVLLALPAGAAPARAGALVGLACLCWGVDNNLTATIGGFTPAQTTLLKGLVAAAVNLSLGALVERPFPGGRGLALALALGAVSYGWSIVLYVGGAQQLGAARSQLLFASGPFLGAALSWLFLRERVQPVQLAAAPLMAAGLALLFAGRHEHAHVHAAGTHTHRHRHDDGHHDHAHADPVVGWHTHAHRHEARTHAHHHVGDLHHRHDHD